MVGEWASDFGAIATGRAYVFDFSNQPAAHVATLNNPDPADFDRFGISVAVSGDKVLVGAHRKETLEGVDVDRFARDVQGVQTAR